MAKKAVVAAPPVVGFRETDALQDYYVCDGKMYAVSRLVDAAKDLVPFSVPIAALDLSGVIWDDCSIFAQAFNVKRVNEADLSYPIILDWNGRVADGRHRIIKAIVEGRSTILAVRISWVIEPDRLETP